ncbi:MAG: acetolactate synthase AlsS [Legionella sp.]|nr:MAG: acetolactate synthase AlsS [Legionella sp.]PJD97418.1 MAG: acetolactate synthase AlsS [Legionella sp.]
MDQIKAAHLVVKCLEAQGVEYVFGIPGAKIDAVFDALDDSSIQLIICRHEQNAAFMAAAYGRLTGRPGVVLVTSGPGVTNLTTGLLTATTEGDPVVAIGGNVPSGMMLRESHQNTDNVRVMAPVTKYSVEVQSADNIPEVFANAFRTAMAPRSGACFISLPQDVLSVMTDASVILPRNEVSYGAAHQEKLQEAAALINQAQCPVLLLGEEASRPKNTAAIHALLEKTSIPTVSTFQAAGVISRSLLPCFAGRVGLFRNQPGDKLLAQADVIVTIGLNLVEYDPETWNVEGKKIIIHLDYIPAKIHQSYQPKLELLGDIDSNIRAISTLLQPVMKEQNKKNVSAFHQQYMDIVNKKQLSHNQLMHPLHFINLLRATIDDNTIVLCDIGSIYMWMARYFLSYQPHHLLFSNGQQTLGVALPWAMAARWVHPDKSIISLSGDGGFLFSAMELETAVREKQHFIHFIWRDGSYDMVKEQEEMKYHREAGVALGKVNVIDFAKAFGAKGYELDHPDNFNLIVDEAKKQKVPVLIDVPIDYSDNPELFKTDCIQKGH